MAGRSLTASAVALVLAAAVACGDSGPRAADRASTPIVLHDAHGQVLPTFAPAQFLVFLPLLRRDAGGVMEGWLARSWEHSPDYRTWTFHLRPDVTWHDGEPVTAHDVKFSLELISHPDVRAWIAPGTFAIRVLDDTTLDVTLQKPVSGFWLDNAATYPKHHLEELDPKRFHDWKFWARPVGNGPYRYVRDVPGTMMEFEANPDYFLGEPAVKRVILKFGAPDISELLSGNVDAIPWVGEADLLKLHSDPRFRTYSKILPAHLGAILWNHARPPFDDPRVRRALTLAIDRRAVIRALTGRFEAIIGEVGTSPSALQREFGSESFLGYRNERASELIARARASIDPDTLDELYRELGAILREDLPMTALLPDYEMHVAHRRVRGLSSPWRAVALRHMEDVWLEGEP